MIDPTDVAVRAELARRELARRRLLHFTKLTHPDYQPGWVHEDICFRLERFAERVRQRQSPRLLLLVPPRHGKALSDDTIVYTKDSGWKTHGTLEVGDKVLGTNGWTTVLAISEPVLCGYEVVTNAKTRIQCHENHEWLIYEWRQDRDRRQKYFERRVETNVFLKWKEKIGGMRYTKPYLNNRCRFFFPTVNAETIPFEAHRVFNRRTLPGRRRLLAVEDVLPLENPKTGRCIQVDAEDGIYLVTRDFVPTHNSELASIRFPAWYLGHNPTHSIMNVSYNEQLPTRFSRAIRGLIREKVYQNIFPRTRLSPDTQAAEEWLLTEGGGFIAAGVGGGITGKGAHILDVDDPIKNLEEADSASTRNKLWDWYQSTAYTRLSPGGGVVWIETFWNDDDGAGRILKAMQDFPDADQFEVVRYPAISESYEYRHKETYEIVRLDAPMKTDTDDYDLLRKPNEALHEGRYNLEILNSIRANTQPRIWSALYQQNPIPDEGIYFTKSDLNYYAHLPPIEDVNFYIGWDLAISTKQHGDYTVGVVIMQDTADRWYVCDLQRFRGGTFEIVETMVNLAEKWGRFSKASLYVGIEDGAIWKAIKPSLENRMRERRVFFPIEELAPLSDKLARARTLQGRMQQKRVYLPEEAPWTKEAVHELLRFPGGVHDDIVDAMSWTSRLIHRRGVPVSSKTLQVKSWRDKLSTYLQRSEGGHMSA